MEYAQRITLFGFYIKPQPSRLPTRYRCSCISFGFYIKPQRSLPAVHLPIGCISFGFYIKPQLITTKKTIIPVVSHLDSTSNHNTQTFSYYGATVVSYLDSTSNHNAAYVMSEYMKLFLIWILHQTTTTANNLITIYCCFLFGFYIKPQPRALYSLILCALYAFTALKNQPFHSEEVDLMRFFQSYRISKNKYS